MHISERRALPAIGTGLVLLLPFVGSPARAEEPEPPREIPSHVGLDLNPIGYTLHPGEVTVDNVTSYHPVGFRADSYGPLFVVPGITYGLSNGLEMEVAVSGAQAIGPAGQATFYAGGLQQRLLGGRDRDLTVSLGGYGYLGPHDLSGGSVYLAASRKVYGTADHRTPAVYLHSGLEAATAVDCTTGVRPFAGINVNVTPRLFVRSEISPRHPSEIAPEFSTSATYFVPISSAFRRVMGRRGDLRVGVTGGVEGTGFRTHGFVGLTFDFQPGR